MRNSAMVVINHAAMSTALRWLSIPQYPKLHSSKCFFILAEWFETNFTKYDPQLQA